jgi:glutamine phosphoribosylpyrophosphate amidotransferase
MCGIVGFLDRSGRGLDAPTSGSILFAMLDALACRGPDGAGIALIREERSPGVWRIRIARAENVELAEIEAMGTLDRDSVCLIDDTICMHFRPAAGVTPHQFEANLDAKPGGLEVLSLGEHLDLVKGIGSPRSLEKAYGISSWSGPLGIGHTRMSTESRIDLSHSQPFWVHGLHDIATVHNGHVTNYHRLRRRYTQRGAVFYTENDSEVIGVILRDRIERGNSLTEAMEDSRGELDGSYNYLVASPEGLGVVRDRFGFKPLMLAETDRFVAVATEEIALRRVLPEPFRVIEPTPGQALFFPLMQPALAL